MIILTDTDTNIWIPIPIYRYRLKISVYHYSAVCLSDSKNVKLIGAIQTYKLNLEPLDIYCINFGLLSQLILTQVTTEIFKTQ